MTDDQLRDRNAYLESQNIELWGRIQTLTWELDAKQARIIELEQIVAHFKHD